MKEAKGMKDTLKISELVESLLGSQPRLRDDDRALYLEVCEIYNEGVTALPFREVWENYQELELPSHLTVERARRKAQEMYPWLRGTKQIQSIRHAEEEKYREFARKAEIR